MEPEISNVGIRLTLELKTSVRDVLKKRKIFLQLENIT